jgi:hypothetical protein
MEETWDEAALERAQERADRVSAAVDTQAESRLRAAAKAARGSRRKLVWLQRAADVVVNTLTRRLENARVLGVHQLVADIRAWFPEVQEGRRA